MKLITEKEIDIQVEVLNESTGGKSIFIEGVFSTIGEKNRNKRVYPQHIWESNVEAYQNEINGKSINTLMEMEHPARTSVDPLEAVARISKLQIEGKYVMGKAKMLNNPKANILKDLLSEGIRIGVSSRGVGDVGMDGVVKQFKLVTYDVVANPSDYHAVPNSVYESFVEGIYTAKSYMITESGIIVEATEQQIEETPIKTFALKDLDKAVVEQYIQKMVQEIFKGK